MNKSWAVEELLRIVQWLNGQGANAQGQPEDILDDKTLKDLVDKLVDVISHVQANILKK